MENNSMTEQEDSSEVIYMAAECLLHISALSLNIQSQDFPLKFGSRPCSDCDSYELHTLGISETIPGDVCCVSSKGKDEFNNKKEVGVKLRRWRRMKNFQKKILPGLLWLSIHKIHEDINILETVLRSKEYKKVQGNTRDEKCRSNSRNKGSIQGYVGRRRR